MEWKKEEAIPVNLIISYDILWSIYGHRQLKWNGVDRKKFDSIIYVTLTLNFDEVHLRPVCYYVQYFDRRPLTVSRAMEILLFIVNQTQGSNLRIHGIIHVDFPKTQSLQFISLNAGDSIRDQSQPLPVTTILNSSSTRSMVIVVCNKAHQSNSTTCNIATSINDCGWLTVWNYGRKKLPHRCCRPMNATTKHPSSSDNTEEIRNIGQT